MKYSIRYHIVMTPYFIVPRTIKQMVRNFIILCGYFKVRTTNYSLHDALHHWRSHIFFENAASIFVLIFWNIFKKLVQLNYTDFRMELDNVCPKTPPRIFFYNFKRKNKKNIKLENSLNYLIFFKNTFFRGRVNFRHINIIYIYSKNHIRMENLPPETNFRFSKSYNFY